MTQSKICYYPKCKDEVDPKDGYFCKKHLNEERKRKLSTKKRRSARRKRRL